MQSKTTNGRFFTQPHEVCGRQVALAAAEDGTKDTNGGLSAYFNVVDSGIVSKDSDKNRFHV